MATPLRFAHCRRHGVGVYRTRTAIVWKRVGRPPSSPESVITSGARYRTVVGLFCAMLGAASLEVRAQESHCWTNQYGADGPLLSGLIVGSFNDLSTTFYRRLEIRRGLGGAHAGPGVLVRE